MNLFDLHGPENNKHSEEIYESQMKRLNNNTAIILQCLIEGQELSGKHLIYYGAKPKGADSPKQMIEYRKRFNEISRSGIKLNEKIGEQGCKIWSLPLEEKNKAIELLAKMKK